jgi:hypothetical protein
LGGEDRDHDHGGDHQQSDAGEQAHEALQEENDDTHGRPWSAAPLGAVARES